MEVLEVARRLSANVSVGMLTNNPPLLRRALPIWFPQIESLFDPIAFSFELKAAKPDTKAFSRVESMTSLSGAELMLIDDSSANVRAAAMLGWQTIYFVGVTELEGDLARLGLS